MTYILALNKVIKKNYVFFDPDKILEEKLSYKAAPNIAEFKDNLSIVPAINSDFITIVCEQTEVGLDFKATPGAFYTVYTLHQTKG